jgi:hypothetical protein
MLNGEAENFVEKPSSISATLKTKEIMGIVLRPIFGKGFCV